MTQWYVFQAMYGKALKAQKMLSERSIRSFVPMEAKQSPLNGGKVTLAPIISNLIFIETTLPHIKELRREHDYLYYLADATSDTQRPMSVPREEMEQFIEFIDGRIADVEYIDPTSFDIKKGARVKIIEGVFRGKEGVLVKVSGKSRKQIVVSIDGLLAVSIRAAKPWSIIERIIE